MLNDRSSPERLLASRRSVKAALLQPPGPSPDVLAAMLETAARVPDHGKLSPWRFVEIVDRSAAAARARAALHQSRPDAAPSEAEALDRFFASAPTLVGLLFWPRPGHKIPLFEQQLSCGAAGYALLAAAHARGFAANWLTGPAARLPGFTRALADTLADPPPAPDAVEVAGFFFIGTPAELPTERPRPAPGAIVGRF